ncbi:MAG: hypothetical protein ACO3K7_04345 [Candidatus Marinamargulisbacteria bacterium]|jgi:hypothetical protein
MSSVYIVVLRNNYLLFSEKKPKKRGNYTQDVRLFKASGTVGCADICQWANDDHDMAAIKEVTDWE